MKTAVFIAHHNIILAAMDHLSPLFHDIFILLKDSLQLVCIFNKALQPHFERVLIAQMKEEAFSLAIDGSNDTGISKMNPVTVRLFDSNTGHVYLILKLCKQVSIMEHVT